MRHLYFKVIIVAPAWKGSASESLKSMDANEVMDPVLLL